MPVGGYVIAREIPLVGDNTNKGKVRQLRTINDLGVACGPGCSLIRLQALGTGRYPFPSLTQKLKNKAWVDAFVGVVTNKFGAKPGIIPKLIT